MRILMLVHNRAGFGTFARAFALARHLVRFGHEAVLCSSARQRWKAQSNVIEGVRVIETFDPMPARLRDGGLSPFDALGRVAHLIAHEKFDVVHAFDHRPTVSIPALWAHWISRTPLIIDWADLWGLEGIAALRGRLARNSLGRFDDGMERWFRTRADGLTVINTALLNRVIGQCPGTPHLLLPVGSNSDRFPPLARSAMREKYDIPRDVPVVVHAGLAPYDMDFLTNSLVELARLHGNVFVLMAGRVFPNLESQLSTVGPSVRVRQLGFISPDLLPEILACGDIMLLPYRDSGVNRFRYPNKLGDYLAAGRPIVTNATGDLGELVRRLGFAVLADETPLAFAQAISSLVRNPQLAEQLGRRGRELSEGELSWERFARTLEKFYEETILRCSAKKSA